MLSNIHPCVFWAPERPAAHSFERNQNKKLKAHANFKNPRTTPFGRKKTAVNSDNYICLQCSTAARAQMGEKAWAELCQAQFMQWLAKPAEST